MATLSHFLIFEVSSLAVSYPEVQSNSSLSDRKRKMHPSAPTGPRRLLALLPLLASASLPSRAVGSQIYHHLLGTSMVWPDRYDPRAVIHSRFQATRDGRVFVASPRYRPGVPFTLGTFRAASAVEPDVWPLPASPAAHRAVACRNAPPPPPLVNVVDLWLDDSGDTLWLLDVGVVDTMTDKPSVIAPAKVVRLDVSDCSDVGPKVSTNRVAHRRNQYKNYVDFLPPVA